MAVALASSVTPVHAERWALDPSVDTTVTWTDNPGLEQSSTKQSDVIFEVRPRLALHGEGRQLRVDGSIAVDGLVYANGTQASRALPQVDLTARAEPIERFFFLEGGVVSRQGAENVFGPRATGASNLNTVTTTQYRLVPSFQGRIGPDVNYTLSSSNSWTSVSGSQTDQNGAYLGDHLLRIERAPQRFGWRIEGESVDTRFESADLPSARTNTGRLALLWALTQGLQVGARGGFESTNIVVDNRHQAIYGAEFAWRPSERTDFNGLWEERYFGGSWQVRFNHRMPRVAWSINYSRNVVSFPQAFLTLPPTNNVAALLDSALTTRYPDPVERGRAVNDLIARQGLPSSLSSQTSLFAQRISLQTVRSASLLLLGIRNSATLTVFANRNEDLTDSVFTPTVAQSARQQGASLAFAHQVSALTSVNSAVTLQRARGVGANEGDRSTQKSLELRVTRQLAPKTNAYCGARVQKFDSNVTVSNANEHAAFVGLGHRF